MFNVTTKQIFTYLIFVRILIPDQKKRERMMRERGGEREREKRERETETERERVKKEGESISELCKRKF